MNLNRNKRLTPSELSVDETILTTQNGYLGVRGCFEEGVPYKETHRGMYINGFYDTHTIYYGESAHGFPETGETMVNLPDVQTIEILLDQEPIDLNTSKIIDLKRSFNLKTGVVSRSVLYETKKGIQIWFHVNRLAHLKYLPLFMIDMTVESVNYDGLITIKSTVESDVLNYQSKDDIRLTTHAGKRLNDAKISLYEDYSIITQTTKESEFKVVVVTKHDDRFTASKEASKVLFKTTAHINEKESIQFQKKVLVYNSLDHSNIDIEIKNGINILNTLSLKELYDSHQDSLNLLQLSKRVEIESTDTTLNESIQYALYQLYTSGAVNERTNIPAKGLSGEGYEGHTFWDTEIYMLPYFMQVDKEKAKNLLLNRYQQLSEAKKEAKLLGVNEGIKFAWRTISGKETSAYYPASTAQYHINADIAFAVIKYYQLYQDETFMKDYGFEMLLETARFFKSVVHLKEGAYHIHHVTGPDEYNAVIDDNYYTHALVKYQLSFLIEYSKTHDVNITKEELDSFKDIQDKLLLLFDKDLNIDVQDASFLSKKPFDFKSLPEDKKPLLLHFHPLTIYRHQILKQADTILSHLLLFDRPLDIMKDSIDFYEPKTTHDSSLSYCVHAAQYAKLGDVEKAYAFYLKTIRLDLDNTHKNTFHGLHVANLGGIYFGLLYGFMGYEIKDIIHVSPRLPKAWKRLKMHCQLIKEGTLRIDITHETLRLKASKDTTISLHQTLMYLKAGEEIALPNSWF